MIVEHVDFWAVPVTDMERSIEFYGGTLGLPQSGDGRFPEFQLGDNGFLYLLSLESLGGAFRAPHDAGFALRVPDARRDAHAAREPALLRRVRSQREQGRAAGLPEAQQLGRELGR